jgi:N-hydroxyarylamine O-acetyltransferase
MPTIDIHNPATLSLHDAQDGFKYTLGLFFFLQVFILPGIHSFVAMESSSFITRYCARLHLDPTTIQQGTLDTLQRIHEAHLQWIPFENLAQHGAVGGPASLDIDALAHKILDRHRGGFCFELNGLLSHFLHEMGYRVTRVSAAVYNPSAHAYYPEPTHIISIVECMDSTSSELYFADVGFGEPALHPLAYPCFEQEQVTPEGMKCLFRPCATDAVELCWWKDGAWKPRLKWNYSESILMDTLRPLSDFTHYMNMIQGPESVFSLQTITTVLTRHEKITVAGYTYKVTSPRFPKDGREPQVTIRTLESEEEVREVLRTQCGIPLEETQGLDLSQSKRGPSVWGQM